MPSDAYVPYYATAAIANGVYSSPSNLTLTTPSIVGPNGGMTVDSPLITVANGGVYRIYTSLNCAYSGALPANPYFSFNIISNGNPIALPNNTAVQTIYGNSNQVITFEVIVGLQAGATVGISLNSSIPGLGIGSGLLFVCSVYSLPFSGNINQFQE